MTERGSIDFMYEENSIRQLIKVIGVGGGGGNAVNMMYKQGTVPGVSFLLCNTDMQALNRMSVEHQVVLGRSQDRNYGLGAGNNPDRARQAAEDSAEAIREAITSDDTRMVFITAGMGGGTGTGAAPVVGRIAMEADMLTVGIVTIPFLFEGKRKILKALRGVDEMRKHVDALLVINNERLLEVYPDLGIKDGFKRADDTLSSAARGISDLVNIATDEATNLDFADVETTLKEGGVAVINTGYATGPNRVSRAIDNALNSPLLNNKKVNRAKKLLLNLYYGPDSDFKMGELQKVNEFTERFSDEVDIIWGHVAREDLGDQIAVTILASGFSYNEEDYTSFITKQEDDSYEAADTAKRKKEEDKRIEEIYGKKAVNKRQAAPLYLRLSELDDEDLILILEETPALMRDRTIFDRKRSELDELRPLRINTQSSQTIRAAAHSSAFSRATSESEQYPEPSPYSTQPEPATQQPSTEAPEQRGEEEDEAFVIRF